MRWVKTDRMDDTTAVTSWVETPDDVPDHRLVFIERWALEALLVAAGYESEPAPRR